MKRFLVRLTLLSSVVAGGFFAITEAQKALRTAQARTPGDTAVAESTAGGRVASDERFAAGDSLAADQRYGDGTYAAPDEPTRLAASPFPESEPAPPSAEAYEVGEPPAQFMPTGDAQPLAPETEAQPPTEVDYPPQDAVGGYPEPAPAFDAPAEPADYEQPAADPAPTIEPAPYRGQPTFDGEPAPADGATPEPPPVHDEASQDIPFDQSPTGDPNAAFDPPAEAAFAEGPAPSLAPVGEEGTGRPGDARLEGPQSPLVTIHKVAPAEVQVGRSAKFQIVIRNSGSVAVDDVRLYDEVPAGARLVGTDPAAERDAAGRLVWALGNLSAGAEATVDIELVPLAEGEIGSVAQVSFATAASARTVATRPALAVDVKGPPEVMIDQPVTLTIKVSNTGTGDATGVYLTNNLPPGLRHPAGEALEYEIGTLKPGESREMELTLTAAQAGPVKNIVTAMAEGDLQAQGTCELQVIAPALEVAVAGPGRRYLDRPAVYTVTINNPGTAPAKDVELVAFLPRGMKFVEADNYGEYDPQTGAVHWMLEELPANEAGEVKLTALPTEAGEHTLRTTVAAKPNLADEAVQQVVVEGVAAVQFEVVDVEDPIEVGGETTYEIRVINQGSKSATNVRLVALLPPELKPRSAEGPSRNRIEGQRVVFEGLPQLAPKADTTYRVRVIAQGAGDARVRVQVLTDDMQTPVTKEESTQVFSAE